MFSVESMTPYLIIIRALFDDYLIVFDVFGGTCQKYSKVINHVCGDLVFWRHFIFSN